MRLCNLKLGYLAEFPDRTRCTPKPSMREVIRSATQRQLSFPMAQSRASRTNCCHDRGTATRAERVAALRDLVSLARPINEALTVLGSLAWDSDEELVTLTRSDVLNVLRMFLAQDLGVDELKLWAEALEGRDDLAFEPGFEEELQQSVFEFSTPEINEPVSPELAVRWESRLS